MARAVGMVKSFEHGTFYLKDTQGNVHQLKAGELIHEGDYVYGAATNTADAVIVIDVLLEGAGDIVLSQNGAFEFDPVVLSSVFSHQEAIVYVNPMAAPVTMAEETSTDKTEAGDETAAGNAVTDTERMVDTFAARDGAITDVATNVNPTVPGGAEVSVTETVVNLVPEAPTPEPVPPLNTLADEGETFIIAEDTSASGNLLLNVIDPDAGDTHSVTQFVINNIQYDIGSTVYLNGVGTIVVEANGDFTFTPLPDYNGPVPVVTYTVSDGTNTVDSMLNITITPVNDGPNVEVIAYQTFTEGEAKAGDIAFTYSGSDPDTPADQLIYTLTNNSNGYLEMGSNNTIVLTQAGADAINADVPISSLIAAVQVSDGSLSAMDSDITSIKPVNDGVSIEAEGPERVFESGLASGTAPSAESIRTSGTFTVADPDGLDDIQSITVAGKVLAVGEGGLEALVGQSALTPYGMIVLTDYNNGTYEYDYVLNKTVMNAPSADSYDYSFDVSVSDGLTSASVPVSVTIVDDQPILGAIQDAIIANATGQVSGLIDVMYGADEQTPPARLIISDYDQLDGIVYHLTPDGQTLTATTEGGDLFYSLNLNSDGSYILNYTDRPVITYPLSFSEYDEHGPSVETISATAGAYTVNFNGALYNGSSLVDLSSTSDLDNLKPTGVGFGVGASHTDQTQINNNEGFIATFMDGTNSLDASSFSFDIVQQGNTAGTTVNWVAYNDGQIVGSDAEYVPLSGSNVPSTFSIDLSDVSGTFDQVDVWFSGLGTNEDVRIEDFSLGTAIIAEDQPLNFEVTAYDADGDISNASTFSVLMQGGIGPDYTLIGSDSDEVLVGGTGSDSLYGAGGNDTLVYDANDVMQDGGTGIDTLVLTGTTSIDFHTLASNSANIEVIDLTSGDHDLSSITYTDVVNMTESGNPNLFIIGDGADQVGFLHSEDWNQTGTSVSYDLNGTSYLFNEYTSTDDPTVTVHVETELPVIM